MRKYLSLFLFIFATSLSAQTSWIKSELHLPMKVTYSDGNGTVFATDGKTICRSIDYGLNWRTFETVSNLPEPQVYNGPGNWITDVKQMQNGNIFVWSEVPGMAGGIWKSENDGSSWSKIDSGFITAMLIDSGNVLVYKDNSGKIKQFGDNGYNWRNAPIGNTWSPSSTFKRSKNGLMLTDPIFNPAGKQLQLSKDNGASWKNIYSNAAGWSSYFITDNNYLYVQASTGVYKSMDYGQNWTLIRNDTEGTLFVSSNELYFYGNSRIEKSVNEGNTWIDITDNLILNGNNLTLYNDCNEYLFCSIDSTIYRSSSPTHIFTNTIKQDFGNIRINDSVETSIIIKNNGALQISDITLSKANSSIEANLPSNIIAARDSMKFTLTYKCTNYGKFKDSIKLQFPCAVQYIECVGNSSYPLFVSNVSTLPFGPVGRNSSKELEIKVTNTSINALTIDSIYTKTLAFVVDKTAGTIGSDTLSLTISFSPTAIGLFNDTLYLRNNSLTTLVKIPLIGSAPVPVLVLRDNKVTFPNTIKGESVLLKCTVVNNSISPLTIDAIHHNSPCFDLVGRAPFVVPANDSLIITVKYMPEQFGTASDTLKIISDGGAAASVVTGNSPYPILHANVSRLSFGRQSTVGEYRLALNIDNPSINALIIDSIYTTSPIFRVDRTNAQVRADTVSLNVTFAPAINGSCLDTLYLSNNGLASLVKIPLDGSLIEVSPAPSLISPEDESNGEPTSLTLKWKPALRAEHYCLQLTTDTTTGNFVVNDSTIIDTTRSISGLAQSTKYYWRLRSINISGKSTFTPYRSFITTFNTPALISVVAGNHQSTLIWSKSPLSNIISYRIYRRTESEPFKLMDSVPSILSTYQDKKLINGIKYYYRIRAVNSYHIEGSFSNEDNAIPFNIPPTAAKLRNINENGKRIWKQSYLFSSGGSYDSDGGIDSVQWYIDDAYVTNEDSLIYDYPQGTTKVMLKVFDTDMASDSSIAFVNRTLFITIVNGPIIGGVTLLGDSTLYAVASGDAVYRLDDYGNIRYSLRVGGEVRSSSSISNDSVVYIASSDMNLYAFGGSGMAIWPARPQGAPVVASITLDTIANRCYVGIQNRNLIAVNRSDGSNLWNYFADAPIIQSAVINADRTLVFSTMKGTFYGFDLKNLSSPVAPAWTLSVGDTITTSPAIDRQSAYYVGTSSGSIIKIEKLRDQPASIVWRFSTKGRIEASPIIDGAGIVYVGSTDSTVYALNSIAGDLKWKYKTHGMIKTTGAVTNQRVVYVGNESGEVFALDSLGKKILYYKADSSISSSIVANKGSLYFGTYSNKIIGIFDDRPLTARLRDVAVLIEPQWSTFQGNNQRTGMQSSIVTTVDNREHVPTSFAMSQNYPNPFNPSTTVQYDLPMSCRVKLKIFNVLGQQVEGLVNLDQPAGAYTVTWNAKVASGMYFYRLEAVSQSDPNHRFIETKKMILLR